MKEQLQQIPARIRELREILELTPEMMADHLRISIGEYRGFEDGNQDIPISMLYEIAALLCVDMTVLLTGDSPRMNTHTVVRRGEGVNVERFEGYNYSAMAYNFIGRIMEPLVVELSPSDAEPALVMHPGQEYNFVLSGKVRIRIGKHDYILTQGDSVYFDPMLPHGQRAVDGAASFLTVICDAKLKKKKKRLVSKVS
jgi:mannose-6-phosphate isomerase-like protein (cupin superfamily)